MATITFFEMTKDNKTNHLFDGRQTWGQEELRAACGKNFKAASIKSMGYTLPVCQTCVRVESSL